VLVSLYVVFLGLLLAQRQGLILAS
jgi:hypothetical protein